MEAPIAVSVVVPSHARHLRLLWLLNALEDQTLAEPWEVVVVHDYDVSTAERVLDAHPLAAVGRLRHVPIEPGTGSPARQRNIGWRDARAPLVAFTDDDCRPEPEWLERMVSAARGSPGAVVQGSTRPDPLEARIFAAPHVRTLHIEPVNAYRQTCNILYPRALLERLDGFDERAVAGEDVGLSLRARAVGTPIVPASAARVYHAVESHSLPGIVRQNLKWRYLAYLVKQHPEFRADLSLRVFWDREHALTALAMVGLLGATYRRGFALLAVPYVGNSSGRRGPRLRSRALALLEVPGQAVRQVAEVAGLAAGSVRHRTLVL